MACSFFCHCDALEGRHFTAGHFHIASNLGFWNIFGEGIYCLLTPAVVLLLLFFVVVVVVVAVTAVVVRSRIKLKNHWSDQAETLKVEKHHSFVVLLW